MNEKKLKIIKSGVKLFAAKGYYQTSIQEIATDAGISKGGFYLYFQSKEDFIATAIQYFSTEISERMETVKQEGLPPRRSLAKQINVFTAYIYKYKDFIIMHLRENISIGQNPDKLIQEMKNQNYHWLRENIQAIYGEQINPYLTDSIIQLEGLMHGYFKWIVVDHIQIEVDKIGNFLVGRLDNIVQGMVQQGEEPLIPEEDVRYKYKTVTNEQQLSDILFTIKEKINTLHFKEEKTDQLHEVADELLKEVNKQEPQHIMIQGLLTHFGRIPVLQEKCEEIAKLLNFDLLD